MTNPNQREGDHRVDPDHVQRACGIIEEFCSGVVGWRPGKSTELLTTALLLAHAKLSAVWREAVGAWQRQKRVSPEEIEALVQEFWHQVAQQLNRQRVSQTCTEQIFRDKTQLSLQVAPWGTTMEATFILPSEGIHYWKAILSCPDAYVTQ